MEHASKDSSTKGSAATRAIYTDGSEPLPLIPGLGRFYEKAAPLSWPIIRFAVSWPLIYRGYHKWSIGLDDAVAPFIALGLKHPVPLAIMSTGLELFGGLGLLLGLFTRFWAAAIALEMAYITFFLYWDNGMSWLNRGYEFSLMWGLVCFAISLRGGGPFSLDRLMRREL